MLITFEKAYYEQKKLWGWDLSVKAVEMERFENIIETIPRDVKTILDVGCGNAEFLRSLLRSRSDLTDSAFGLERSATALEYARELSVSRASLVKIPFGDKRFDLVTCLEVLEHLSQSDYRLALKELNRVAINYLLVTVPNSEDLESSLSKCPKCYCHFNSCHHVRSFDLQSMKCLFEPSFKVRKLTQIGPPIMDRAYPQKIKLLHNALLGPLPPASAICPQCGFQMPDSHGSTSPPKQTGIGYRSIKSLANAFFPKYIKGSRWILALYERRTTE